ncbi:hypothetical protein OIU85_021401 [Salix viminalis]|uniref:Protein kinase domain-containing protein n=1 Tax=Salix viminalis TaxID=40686 RepID=A0A9Q0ZDK5_SALVM|nr:hypothetical protein OIU85_021401 [Salix viminalis]
MGFHRSRIIGQGASATVVKLFPFITEFATMVLGFLRHENLVQLQGWCCEGTVLLSLVQEHLPSGSTRDKVHKSTSSAIFLSWKQRLNIVPGVAPALSYIKNVREIIHRDVKVCNTMLDTEFNVKLGDFGLAKSMNIAYEKIILDQTYEKILLDLDLWMS